ncbi:hypothetical protein [Fiji disease virus]|uniref:Putative outer capsid protein p10 n=1 Tax=Fiji disease virus (isolate Sugarcane) TaxID=648172 RepID=VP10_FDVS|nr:hypothetical protein [Fiji disease virus]Q7TF74.1 RecName: Full=Putative outer capsid protein p10 [Fiji disease virus isolate Sugarcane]AAP57258.1 unknown protein [Fiji disease virus]
MTSISLTIAPDLIHCGVPQRLSDTIILNDKPKITLLSYFDNIFTEANIIKAPKEHSVQSTVNIYVKLELLKRLYDRLQSVDTSTLPYISQIKEALRSFLHNDIQYVFTRIPDSEIDGNYVGVTTHGLSLFANAKNDAEEIERVQIDTPTEGNLTLKPISADGVEVVLDDSYINAVSKVIGPDVHKLIDKCCKEFPAHVGTILEEVKYCLILGKLRLAGGYDYNCPSSTTDVTRYGDFDKFRIKMFNKLTRFYNVSLALVPCNKLKMQYIFDSESEKINGDRTFLDQAWPAITSFIETHDLATKVKTDDPDTYVLKEVKSCKINSSTKQATLVNLDGNKLEWYKNNIYNAKLEDGIVINRELYEKAADKSYIKYNVKVVFASYALQKIIDEKSDKSITVDTSAGEMTLDKYRAIANVLNSIWKRGKDMAIKYFDYIKMGIEKATHLSLNLMKKYNITLDDVVSFIEKGPGYLATLQKLNDYKLIAKIIICHILPTIIQCVYKSDPNSKIMNSTLITNAVNLIRQDTKRYESSTGRKDANLVTHDASSLPLIRIYKT